MSTETRPKGLSCLYWTLLHLIDAGVIVDIDEAWANIRRHDVIPWLTTLSGDWEAERGILALVSDDEQSVYEINSLLDNHVIVEPSAVAVSSNGLCLLLGYCLNEMQSAR